LGIGNWELGIGNWELGIGDEPQRTQRPQRGRDGGEMGERWGYVEEASGSGVGR
jgi:hypothetical protein